MATDPERIAVLETKDGNREKDIDRIEDAMDKVGNAVAAVGLEVAGLRQDIASIQQKRARDIGFIAGVSAAVSFIMGAAGVAVDFVTGGSIHHGP